MFKYLPTLFTFSFVFVVFTFLTISSSSAQTTVTQIFPNNNTVQQIQQLGVDEPDADEIPDGNWVSDSNVTFVGKTASRSGDFLDWTLRNYDWACVLTEEGVCTSQGNPLVGYWALIRNIVYALLVAVVIVAAFVIIITRGRSLTVMRFIPRFILIIVLVTLSYSLIQFIYQITDIIQGFFLRVNGSLISTRDLIFIGFNYQTFEGLRLTGSQYDESAFITLLLVRLTAITYYVMTGVLIIRKIILWFFLVLSPVFPLLLFFRPVRNTGKIWIGEFFRWLLYAPLFAIFLHGLVVLWSSSTGIPLAFDFTGAKAGEVVYPTAVNILIGGPGQQIGSTNSVNLQDTFALYVVALLMLWVVILLPFILLKIFLDYLMSISFKDNVTLQKLWDKGVSQFNPRPPAPVTPHMSPPPAGAGLAKALPFSTGMAQSIAQASSMLGSKNISNVTTINNVTSNPVNTQILRLANLSVPKMKDIARFETSMLSKDTTRKQEVSRLKTSLTRIANPNTIVSVTERDKYHEVKQKLLQEKQNGNPLATNILNAANTTSRSTQAHMPGKTIVGSMNLPTVNKTQQVSVEDYEEVRKMWVDTYQNSEPPTDLTGKKSSRDEWLKGDVDKINQAITLLSSIDPARSQEGMDMVSNILPFLMVGGFSKTEVIAYLKAKLEAAKQVMQGVDQKREDEDTLVERKTNETTAEKHMTMEAAQHVPEVDSTGLHEAQEKKLGEVKKDSTGLVSNSSGQEKVEELRKQGSM